MLRHDVGAHLCGDCVEALCQTSLAGGSVSIA
jgi:hypothetical protein